MVTSLRPDAPPAFHLLAANRFLVGISIDGPREMYDLYRYDKGGGPTFHKVKRGLDVLKRHGVE